VEKRSRPLRSCMCSVSCALPFLIFPTATRGVPTLTSHTTWLPQLDPGLASPQSHQL